MKRHKKVPVRDMMFIDSNYMRMTVREMATELKWQVADVRNYCNSNRIAPISEKQKAEPKPRYRIPGVVSSQEATFLKYGV